MQPFLLGLCFWGIFMATSIHFGRKFINHDVMKWISIVAGIVLILFGIYFGYEAVEELLNYCELFDD